MEEQIKLYHPIEQERPNNTDRSMIIAYVGERMFEGRDLGALGERIRNSDVVLHPEYIVTTGANPEKFLDCVNKVMCGRLKVILGEG